MNSSIRDILEILLVAFPLMFALMLLTEGRRGVSANRSLALYMVITAIQFFTVLMMNHAVPMLAKVGYYLAIPLMLVNSPLLYYYVVKLTSYSKVNKRKFLWHYSPALLSFIIGAISYSFISADTQSAIIFSEKLDSINSSDRFWFDIYRWCYQISNVYLYNVQVVFYGIMMLIRYKKHGKFIKSYFSYTENISLKWLLGFIVIFWVVSFYELFFYENYRDFYFVLFFLYIGFLGYFGFKQRAIYYQGLYLEIQEKNLPVNSFIPKDELIEITIKKNETITEEQIKPSFVKEQIALLESIMETQKPYMNSNLNISELADLMGIHRNNLSMLINDYYHKNFFSFINEYRIQESKAKLIDPAYNHLSIEGIAKSVGFNSKSVFNPAFKKITGLTPVEYKKNPPTEG